MSYPLHRANALEESGNNTNMGPGNTQPQTSPMSLWSDWLNEGMPVPLITGFSYWDGTRQITQVNEEVNGRTDVTNGAAALLGGNYHAASVRDEEIVREQDVIGFDIGQTASIGSGGHGAHVAEPQDDFLLAYQDQSQAFLGVGSEEYYYPTTSAAHVDWDASSELRAESNEDVNTGHGPAAWVDAKQKPERNINHALGGNAQSKLIQVSETKLSQQQEGEVHLQRQINGSILLHPARNSTYASELTMAQSQGARKVAEEPLARSSSNLSALSLPVSISRAARSSAVQSSDHQSSPPSRQSRPNVTMDEEIKYSKAGLPVLPGKKKQTKPPYKRNHPPPRARAPTWPDYYDQTPELQANPGGWEAAHKFIIGRQDIPGLLKIGCELINSKTGDWKSKVRNSFLNAWILKRHKLVPFTRGGKDHGAQNDWHDARSRQERDEIRVYIMQRIEEKLLPWMKARVKLERETVQAVAGPLSASVHDGSFWASSPVVGGMQLYAPQSNGVINSAARPTGQGSKLRETHQGRIKRPCDEDEEDSDYQETQPRTQKKLR